MLPRSLRLWLLAAALLLTQLGGLLHGLSHTFGDKERPHSACQLCVAYSAFDHATAGTAALTPLTGDFILAAALPPGQHEPSRLVAFQARAPPPSHV